LPHSWLLKIWLNTRPSLPLQGEFIGTMLFVFLATTGSGTALAVGISYAVASYAVAALSGGHLNPVVSIAFALSGHQHAALSGAHCVHLAACGLDRKRNLFRVPMRCPVLLWQVL